jgi:predicted acylesterase/phospholipase RssA
LALAGGGARGLVHFGVLRALDRAGFSFDFMSGTSAGSMFGLSYATGLDTDFLIDAYTQNLTPPKFYRWLPNGDRWFLLWKYRSRGWDKMLRPYFNWNFEQLPIPFSSVAVDLVRGKQVITESGDIIEAMLESLNLPVIARPILKDGMALVDGGVLDNLPAGVLVDKKADFVVGVVVTNDLEPKYGKNRPGMKTSEMKRVGGLESMFRILEVMGTGTKDAQRSAVDMLIDPDTSEFSFTDFTQGEPLAEIGESVMEKLIPKLRKELDDLLRFKAI